jgi:hypothetical protein
MTLHDRIRAVVEERLAVARRADLGWCRHDCDPVCIDFHAVADEADAILSAEHALSVLERHAIIHRDIGWLELDEGELCEMGAEIPVCRSCVPKHSSFRTRAAVPEGPCIEVRELATRWRVEVDG